MCVELSRCRHLSVFAVSLSFFLCPSLWALPVEKYLWVTFVRHTHKQSVLCPTVCVWVSVHNFCRSSHHTMSLTKWMADTADLLAAFEGEAKGVVYLWLSRLPANQLQHTDPRSPPRITSLLCPWAADYLAACVRSLTSEAEILDKCLEQRLRLRLRETQRNVRVMTTT